MDDPVAAALLGAGAGAEQQGGNGGGGSTAAGEPVAVHAWSTGPGGPGGQQGAGGLQMASLDEGGARLLCCRCGEGSAGRPRLLVGCHGRAPINKATQVTGCTAYQVNTHAKSKYSVARPYRTLRDCTWRVPSPWCCVLSAQAAAPAAAARLPAAGRRGPRPARSAPSATPWGIPLRLLPTAAAASGGLRARGPFAALLAQRVPGVRGAGGHLHRAWGGARRRGAAGHAGGLAAGGAAAAEHHQHAARSGWVARGVLPGE